MEGFEQAFDAGALTPFDAVFDKVSTQNQIELVDLENFGDDPEGDRGPVVRSFHQLTSSSKSLLTDSALGGFRKDLTRYFEDGDELNDIAPIADLARYALDDPRFATWGGTNTGFPNNNDLALDGGTPLGAPCEIGIEQRLLRADRLHPILRQGIGPFNVFYV